MDVCGSDAVIKSTITIAKHWARFWASKLNNAIILPILYQHFFYCSHQFYGTLRWRHVCSMEHIQSNCKYSYFYVLNCILLFYFTLLRSSNHILVLTRFLNIICILLFSFCFCFCYIGHEPGEWAANEPKVETVQCARYQHKRHPASTVVYTNT